MVPIVFTALIHRYDVGVREAGGASTIADAAGAVFHPWLYAAIVARGVALGMRLRSVLRSG